MEARGFGMGGVMDEVKLMEFVGKVVGDLGGALTATLVNVGDRLGLYAATAGTGCSTSRPRRWPTTRARLACSAASRR